MNTIKLRNIIFSDYAMHEQLQKRFGKYVLKL